MKKFVFPFFSAGPIIFLLSGCVSGPSEGLGPLDLVDSVCSRKPRQQ